MRLLVDQNVPRAVVKGLREDGHDVTWAQTTHPGADDEKPHQDVGGDLTA